ncbi:sensor histidine kinase [Geomesophilobacter sediminis]|uniref:histidine kinase n=1 Tax=Geomesophilobacter sediminis TaxID=2798584 RepID=A0A8J7S889_9BACT|nr:HAMP domain-containing sensor histidine kinase [Geomesophilobacter sediminis]MBJ6727432.1 HAMP domain-containing protein [Geomesophilobacter sediminis]
MKAFRFSLNFYILSVLSCLLVLTWILLSLISFKTAENDLIAQKGEQARLLLSAAVELLPRPLAAPEPGSAAARYLQLLASEKGFAGFSVIDRSGRTVFGTAHSAATDPELDIVLRGGKGGFHVSSDGRFVNRYLAVNDGTGIVGAGRLTLSLAPEQERLRESRHLFLAYFILDFLLLLVLGSFLLTRSVVIPVRKLVAATRRIAAGDLEETVHVPGSTEIAELSDSFNAMVLALRQKRVEVDEKVASLNRANSDLVAARSETIRSEKMASVGLIAAGMAHEIGTPLAAIMGYTELLADDLAGDAEKSDYLRRITAESSRIDRIVRGLLDYARPRQSVAEAVELLPLMEKTVELLDAQGVLKRLDVLIEAEPELPTVQADPYQLEQLLINLIMNARDAMPDGGDLQLKGRREGDEVLLEVIDSGAGISAEKLPLVFDPFFTTKEPGKGTGLGLAIAARIADSCGGRITVESQVGKGSRFVVRLPASSRIGSPQVQFCR